MKPMLAGHSYCSAIKTLYTAPVFLKFIKFYFNQARKAQEPIIIAGKSMIDGACHMLQGAKQLAVNPRDPATYQLYSSHSKSVSDAIKHLVSSIK